MQSPITGKPMKLVREPGVKLSFRKEEFEITYHYYLCEQSGEQFTDDKLDTINQVQVHNKYREKYGIPFPEEIKQIRELYGISASKMSEILGFGANSYRLYENGEIPSVSNGRLITDAKKPEVFLKQVLASSELLAAKEKEKLVKKTQHMILESRENIWACLVQEENAFFYEFPNHFSGFRKLDKNKIAKLINYYGKRMELLKTKLNKILFYTDFSYFSITGFSMTGISYRAIDWGPVPAEYDILYPTLAREGRIRIINIELPNGYDAEKFEGTTGESEEDFDDIELYTIKTVLKKFKAYSVKQIVDYSHEEKAWAENHKTKGLISYTSYAFELNNFDLWKDKSRNR